MPQGYRNRLGRRGYRHYDPTYQAAGFNPAVFEGSSMDFKPYDFSIYERGLANLEARMNTAAEKQGAIDMALANIELQLNPAEREWFAGYKQKIKNQVQGDIDAGNFGSAIRKATKLAGQVASDSKILNRIEYNKAYQQEKDKVLNDKNISQTRKDRWIEENPYNYQDKFDDNGNVVGGTEWNPNWRPYSSLDMAKIYDTVKSLASVEAGGGESAQFLDENGNLTSDPSKGIYGMAVKRGSRWERLPADKLKRVFDNLFAQIPDAKEALLQQMDDRIWEYNKASDEDKKAFIGSDIVKDDGTFRSPQEYLDHIVNPVLTDMAYNKAYSTVDYGQAYALAAKDRKEKAGKEALLALQGDMNNTTFTAPITIENKDRAARTYAEVNNALSSLNKLVPGFNSKEAKDFRATRDYDGLSNYLEKQLESSNLPNADKHKARQAIRTLRNNGKIYNRLIEPLDDDEIAAAEFLFAKESGSTLPDAKNNKFSLEYSKAFNNIFGYSTPAGRGVAAKYTPIDTIGAVFADDKQKRMVLYKLGLNESELAQHGLGLKTIDGKTVLTINKNSDKLDALSDAFEGTETGWFRKSSKLIKFDNNGNVLKTQLAGYQQPNANFYLKQLSSNSGNVVLATNKVNKAFGRFSDATMTQTLEVKPFDDYNTLMLNNLWVNGIISPGDYSKNKKEFEENNKKAFGLGVAHLSNFEVYGINEDTGTLVKLNPKEIEDAQKKLLNAYDENRYNLSPSDAPTGKGYGTIVKVKGKEGKNEKESTVYYIDGLLSGPAATAVANDPTLKARQEYQVARSLGVVDTDVAGNPVVYNNPELAISQYKAKAELDDFYRLLDKARTIGETFTEEEAKAEATKILLQSGYSPEYNGEAFNEARAKIVIDLLNYYGD